MNETGESQGTLTISAKDVVDRMREAVNVSTDADLAKVIAVAPATIASWRKRDSVPYEHAISLSVGTGVSAEWLLLGRGAKDERRIAKGPLDLEILTLVIEAVDHDWSSFGYSKDSSKYKARQIRSFYNWCVLHLDSLMATGKFTRVEAISLLQAAPGWPRRASSPSEDTPNLPPGDQGPNT